MASDDSVNIPPAQLRAFMTEVFTKAGVPGEDARICSDVLMAADLRGIDSHGINRLQMYIDRIDAGTQLPVTDYRVIEDRQATAVIDAGNGMGQVAAFQAMRLAITKASEYGCGVVTVRNGNHFGIAGYYALMATAQEMVGIALTNARPAIAPTFGTEPLLGTNPIAFGAPSDLPYPFLLDMATSISQRGKIEVLQKKNQPVPPGWVINKAGEAATDAQQILEALLTQDAALAPLGGLNEISGGHKGYGLATMVEILSTALSQANFLRDTSGVKDGNPAPLGLGHFFMAIDVAHFIEVATFKKVIGTMMQIFRQSRQAPGSERIYVAGEKEYLMQQQRQQQGIPINKTLQRIMLELQQRFALTEITLPWPAA